MRLTLRTLLAYLDDILPPAETKEIGEKIAGTPVASQLVDRIRDVMRRRRLTAPEPDGSGGGIEPNLVAEYLDNSLPPERVTDVERVCLESDVNLAEVAASHQILTLVIGEPVEISGRLRERMYALGPQGTPLEVPEPAGGKRTSDMSAREQLAAIKSAQRPKPAPTTKSLESRLPDYLKQKPLWKRVLPWAAVAAILAGWLGVLAWDPTYFGGRRGEKAEGSGAAKEEAPAEERVAREREPARDEVVEPADAAVIAAADLPVDPEPPADEPPPANTDVARAESDAATTDPTTADTSTAETSEPAEPTEATAAVNAPPAAPVDPRAPQVDLVSTTGVVLRNDPKADQWFPLAAVEEPPAGAALAVPEPFEAQFSIAGLPQRITVLGGTRLAPLGGTAAGPVGVDLAQGRLRISVDTAQAAEVEKMMFALRLGPALWRIEPLTPDTMLGIEALPLQPTAENEDLAARTPQGVIYVGAGAVRVADSGGRVEVASAGNRLILTPEGGIGAPASREAPTAPPPAAETEIETEAGADVAAEAETPADADTTEEPAATATVATAPDPAAPAATVPPGIPEWMTPREPTSAARRAMAAFQKEFISGVPAGQSLVPAADSRLFFVAEPAAKALALLEDVDGMVKTLASTEHPEAVLATIDGLRNWLGRHPGEAERLREALGLVFTREGLADTVLRLLWGYGPEDARDAVTAQQLVDWLDHAEPIVRELAFYHVRRLSGRTMYYRPNQTPSDRAGAVNRWREFVSRNGGLVIGAGP